jgi:hypothetical protein
MALTFPRANGKEAISHFQLEMAVRALGQPQHRRFGKLRENTDAALQEINDLAKRRELFPTVQKSHGF